MSLTLTGNELGTSTATISRALSSAREFFGDELFIRSGPRMVPTSRMRELLPDIDDILHRLEKLSAPSVFDPAGLNRTFRIAAADNGILAFLFPALKQILQQAPQVRLDIIGLNGDLFDDLRNGLLDLAIFPFDPIPPECRSIMLADEPDVLIVRKNHPLVEIYKQKGALGLEDIQAYPKVRISMPYFLAAPWIVLETDSTAKILEKNGRLLSRYLPLEVLPLPPSIAGRYERRVIWHENASGDPALRWFIAMIQTACREQELTTST